jgi:hypothetical protein
MEQQAPITAEVLPTHTPERAAALLRSGEVVALPVERGLALLPLES